MNINKILFNIVLLIASWILIAMYFNVPFYEDWLNTKLLNPNNSILDQAQNLDLDYRNQYRFGGTYSTYKDIQRVLGTKKNVTLLLPNNDYIRSLKITQVDMPEPAVFYYWTGINSVWASSPGVEKANWALVASKRLGFHLVEIKRQTELDSLIAVYKPFAQ